MKIITLGTEGLKAIENNLLEKRIWDWILSQNEDNRTMNELFKAGFGRHEAGPGIGLLKSLGVSIEKGIFIFNNEEEISGKISERVSFIQALSVGKISFEKLDSELVKHFSGRKNLINIEEYTVRKWKLTEKGINIPDKDLEEIELIGEITPEFLQKEGWENASYKEFDINADTPIPVGGRPHPMQSLIERIRSVFLEMGFSEIEGNYVLSCF